MIMTSALNQMILDSKPLNSSKAWELMTNPGVDVGLSSETVEKIRNSRQRVEKVLNSGETVYGINTGFGALAEVRISDEDLLTLQGNLIRSHCVGVGRDFPDQIVRGILLLRAHTLSLGFSGVRVEVVEQILSLLNHNILPRIPRIGSLGASGDLAPLAHMSLALLGEGEVRKDGELIQASKALGDLGLAPLVLEAKEGLALINGTPVMCAIGVECIERARILIKSADIIAAMCLEALSGTDQAFLPRLHELRPHHGQRLSARNLYNLLQDSAHRESHRDCGRVQDAYSLRCIPQVHGTCYDAFFRTLETLEIEINSVTDNPIVLEDAIISCGHFHGEPVSMVLCYLAMGLSELASLSERRQNRLMNHHLSHLPPFLIENSGLNSGLMIAHYTSAACVSENKGLAYPAVVDSIPTSADQEDHVSMGVTSAKNCLRIIENLESVLSIELLMAAQGLEYASKPVSASLQNVFEELREIVEPVDRDRVFKGDIENARNFLRSGRPVKLVESSLGNLMKE